ncbi:IS3 family transposase [Niallia sp. RD1]|uniref:IS3 family transposase n=1 Tax=Niallia sp. RD1 TaxID=2962858 RepID=UPI0020C1A11A|nr:IS3 family transposase [Niallia sp. RD1]UTI44283.1 IS3 family transposase [Niallia sp. RD1]
MDELKKKYPIGKICAKLQISRAGYYKYEKKKEKKKRESKKERQLKEYIQLIYEEHKSRYGYRKIRAVLNNQYNIPASEKVVRRLMQELGLKSKARKWKKGTKQHKVASAGFIYENILQRDFSTKRINEKWVTDVTEISYGNGKLYLSTILDLHNNRVLGHSIAEIHDVNLVKASLLDTLKKRKNKNKKLILHSDQGFTYRSTKWHQLVAKNQLTPSMSRKANPFDNACIESFFSYLKTECLEELKVAHNQIEAIKVINDFVYYYNHKRIQSTLNYKTPNQYVAAS